MEALNAIVSEINGFLWSSVIIILLGRLSYKFGYNVFYEQPVAEAPGTDVVVTIPEGVSAHQIGKLLEEAILDDVGKSIIRH